MRRRKLTGTRHGLLAFAALAALASGCSGGARQPAALSATSAPPGVGAPRPLATTAGTAAPLASGHSRAPARPSEPPTTAPSTVPSSATTRATSPVAQPTRPPSRTGTPAPAPAGTIVSSWDSPSLGETISDATGRTLYIFTPDDGASSPQCTSTGGCSTTWPPLRAHGALHAQGQARQTLLGTEDGQVTYNGHPLYFYAGDSGPHQTNGQGVGGIWYVINTDGSVHV